MVCLPRVNLAAQLLGLLEFLCGERRPTPGLTAGENGLELSPDLGDRQVVALGQKT